MKRALLAAACWLTLMPGVAARAVELVVVMDDLGYSLARAERVLALPAPVTLALLPFAPATPAIARRAAQTGHELILHQPMEALPSEQPPPALGTLTADMSAEAFGAQLDAALAAVPGIVGLNNHTGSRLTQDVPAMRRLMAYLADRGLMFLDSRTTAATVAFEVAREAQVPALQRDVFLDHDPRPDALAAQFQRALAIARRQGSVVIIAHPHDTSLAFLSSRLQALPPEVSLSTLRRLAERPRPAVLARQQSPGSPHRSLGQ